MILTDEEKRMRDGAEGAATAAAMDLLIRYGDALACERLCDVRNVAGSMTQPSPPRASCPTRPGTSSSRPTPSPLRPPRREHPRHLHALSGRQHPGPRPGPGPAQVLAAMEVIGSDGAVSLYDGTK